MQLPYHQVSRWGDSICMFCSEDMPLGDETVTKGEHTYENGYCTVCNMQEIPSVPDTYYAPYDGYTAYKSDSETSARVNHQYKAGDKIVISKKPYMKNGILWGKLDKGYVMMRTLSTVPVKSVGTEKQLTNQELIEWCVKFDGKTPFLTYGYHAEMLNTIGAADILLMSINSRASGLADQLFTWLKESCGDTLAESYYEGQVMAMLTALEAEADYSFSIEYKDAIKYVLKMAQIPENWALNYKRLKKSEIESLNKLKACWGGLGDLLSNGELGVELASYIVMDFARMQGIIEAARLIQRETYSDPDLYRAFDEVVSKYESRYYMAADQICDKILEMAQDSFKENVETKTIELIKMVTGKNIKRKWSKSSFVYSVANFVTDFTMSASGGEKYSKSMLKFMSQISVVNAASGAYQKAVNNIKEGDHSANAVETVRWQFAAYKVSMVELYDTMLSMATNHMLNIGEDAMLIAYLQHEKAKLESIYMVNDLNQMVNGISLTEYERIH